MNQAEADRIIRQRIDKAIACEVRRDATNFDSPTYWRHHDRAIY